MTAPPQCAARAIGREMTVMKTARNSGPWNPSSTTILSPEFQIRQAGQASGGVQQLRTEVPRSHIVLKIAAVQVKSTVARMITILPAFVFAAALQAAQPVAPPM